VRQTRRTRPLPREAGLLLLLLALVTGFAMVSAPFRDPFNFLDRTRQWVEIGMIAVPMTFIIATGGIDLSVGSLLVVSSVVSGLCFQQLGWPLPLALVAGALTGTLGGTLNGVCVSLLRVPALVVTLASMAIFRGLAMGLSEADPISSFPSEYTTWGALGGIGSGDYIIPYQTLIFGATVLFGDFVLRRTCVGRWSVQVGENAKAARFTTVPVSGLLILLYGACGLVCGLGAILYTARFGTAHPGVGRGLELEVIACVVIGGTRITGGNASVLGTFLGVLILGVLRFGLDMVEVLQKHQVPLVGLLVIATAILNEWLTRRTEASNAAARKGEPHGTDD
jgi:rhamnose transport system permease protein